METKGILVQLFGYAVFFAAIAFIIGILSVSGCAHTEITHGSVACGTFESSDTGLGLVVPTAGQYATYSSACATRRTVEVIAAQREAVVQAAWAAAAKVDAVDSVARRGAARALKGNRTTRRALTDHLAEEGGAQ